MKPVRFDIVIPSHLKWLEWVETILDRVMEHYALSENGRSFTNLALHEAVVNAIVHGNKQDENLRVTIQFELLEEKFEIFVRDQGEGFDPADVPDPTQPEFRLSTHGRGLLFMRSFLDELYFCKEKEGMCVRLVKYARRLSS